MIQLMMLVSLAAAQPQTVQPCVWPNRCAAELAAAPVQPCVWPNRCVAESPAVAQFQPCVWPNKCSGAAEPFSFKS